ncbi:class I SAM-dependent methyltransferase [Streptomyces sp. NP-1717]|uniref:class I SAM-dependent methyltransferase n=1 Tax=unclassified Streptomyces TaxID=2593676 RepID=UPI001F5D8B43|nr:methyltransferase domain-containing protein [Streptomyces sp. NP-1717]WTA77735.1 methyltransferase domain-containing protein [Streptomyces sp. NBC_00838]
MSGTAQGTDTRYLPGMSLHDYEQHMKEYHQHVAELLDPARMAALTGARWLEGRNEFDTDDNGGRGDSYRRAQRADGARRQGIARLFTELAGPDHAALSRVLDVLGGDGLLTRVWRGMSGARNSGPVPLITGDVSAGMVRSALDRGLPAVRQQAHSLLHRDGVLDGVLLAYGTHHLEVGHRPAALREAYRCLGRGGRVALHDFDERSAVARWFREAVAPYSRAGHAYPHFTAEEMRGYLESAGFADVEADRMYDPVVIEGDSEEEALAGLADYMTDMYGLALITEAAQSRADARDTVLCMLRDIFRYTDADLPYDAPGAVRDLTVHRAGARFRAELPRVALLATGTKN